MVNSPNLYNFIMQKATLKSTRVHRLRNILCKLPEKARPGLKKLIQKAFTAQSYKAGLEQAKGGDVRANLLERLFGEGQRRSKVIPRSWASGPA